MVGIVLTANLEIASKMAMTPTLVFLMAGIIG
jgi:hypothetical protein